MKFAALLTVIASALLVRGADDSTQDVWAPPITFPTAGVNLVYGQTYNFTWDASSPPPQITNNVAVFYLRQNSRTLPIILAGNVPITQGYTLVTIPWVDSGTYQTVLFGDSGNFSPDFQITSPDPHSM